MSDLAEKPLCSSCGFPLDEYKSGLRYFGTHVAHVEWYCVQRLRNEVETLRNLLHRARPIIDADAQMMADITRHAPLPLDAQAIHDGTEYESERLAREIRAAMKDRP